MQSHTVIEEFKVQDIVRLERAKRRRWEGHVARMNQYRIEIWTRTQKPNPSTQEEEASAHLLTKY